MRDVIYDKKLVGIKEDNGRWTDGSLDHASKAIKTCEILHQGSRRLIDEHFEKMSPICQVSYLSAQIFQEPVTYPSGKVYTSTICISNSQLVEDCSRYHHAKNSLE